jgi:hypothetical protein
MATEVLGVQAVFASGTPPSAGAMALGLVGVGVGQGWEITIYFCVVMGSRRHSACVNNHNYANSISRGCIP